MDVIVPTKVYLAETPNKMIEIWSDEPVDNVNHHIIEHCYIRKDVVEHIIRSALGPKDALYKIRSL